MPQDFNATRYHSLTVLGDSDDLRVVAVSRDRGDILALEHRSLPRYGLQFHPESVATDHGHVLAANFIDVVREHRSLKRSPFIKKVQHRPSPEEEKREKAYHIEVTEVPWDPRWDVLPIYRDVFHGGASFWLDGDGIDSAKAMGDAGGPHGFAIAHDARKRVTTFLDDASLVVDRGDLLPYLRKELRKRVVDDPGSRLKTFDLGFVGYIGYELRSQTHDYEPAHVYPSPTPDAALIFCGRAIVFEGPTAKIIELKKLGSDHDDDFKDRALAALERHAAAGHPHKATEMIQLEPLDFRGRWSAATYAEKAKAALDKIAAGDSYEVCLTTAFDATLNYSDENFDPLPWFAKLRARNPAPKDALLDFVKACGVAICSSSPERFVRVHNGNVEAKPIKGTAPRSKDPGKDAADAANLVAAVKTRAENLMIADLLRADLLRVCDEAHVEKFAHLESFATVHQLVTTVRGRLAPRADALDVVDAAFPPGSMTGAPKRRTADIIHHLEQTPRGPYSGALGFFGLHGDADLAVIIRTALFDVRKSTVSIGAGGALTALSDIDDEWDEVRLKARAVINAIGGNLVDNLLPYRPTTSSRSSVFCENSETNSTFLTAAR